MTIIVSNMEPVGNCIRCGTCTYEDDPVPYICADCNPGLLRARPKHKHREAFCLMHYASPSATEIIWNSRDGVTPFSIKMKDLSTGYHVISRLIYAPRHTPAIGDRIFVNLSLHEARALRRTFVVANWSKMDQSIYESSYDAMERLAQYDISAFGVGTTPHLVTVDEWILNDIISRRA